MARGIDFKQKEVVSLNEGKILGFVVDVQADFITGEINSIIVAKTGKIFGNIMGKNNLTIPWDKIKKIGEGYRNNPPLKLELKLVPGQSIMSCLMDSAMTM